MVLMSMLAAAALVAPVVIDALIKLSFVAANHRAVGRVVQYLVIGAGLCVGGHGKLPIGGHETAH